MTITLSKTLRSSALWRVDSRCAVHAIVFDFPDPAECWTRYEWPAPFSIALASSLRTASHWWYRGKMTFSAARRAEADPFAGRSTWMKRWRMSSHASFVQTRSQRYEVLCPLGFDGFPLPRL